MVNRTLQSATGGTIEGRVDHQVQLLSFRNDDTSSFGAVIEGRIVDLGRHLPEYESLKALLMANALVKALDTAAEVSPDFRLDKVDLLAPVSNMEHLLCVFDDAVDDAVGVDPKFIRGASQSLRIPADDQRPVAVGIGVVVSAEDDGYQVLGYTLMSYLSPAAFAAGPWLTTSDELPRSPVLDLHVVVGAQATDLLLQDPAGIALSVAEERTLVTGDMVAVLHFLPELTAGVDMSIEIESEALGRLSNPVKSQSD